MNTVLSDATGNPALRDVASSQPASRESRIRYPTGGNAPDVLVQNFGSVVILWPRTDAAKDWFAENVDTQATWGAGTVCEPRYVDAIVDGLMEEVFDVVHN